MLGIVGESGSGKSVSSLDDHGPRRARSNARISGRALFGGRDLLALPDAELTRAARRRDRDDLPGPAVVAASVLPRRRPARGGDPGAPRRVQGAGARSRDRAARARRDPRAQAPRRLLPARVLGRDAPARDDRHGARQRARPAHRRRADDGARRHRAGPDPRAHRAAEGRARDGGHHHHPRPRRRRGDERRRRGDVRRADRRARARRARIFAAPEHPYTWGLLRSIPRLDVPRDEPLVPISGQPPSLITLPTGCSFHPRCPYVRPSHRKIDPSLEPVPDVAAPRRRLPAAGADAPRAVARAARRRRRRRRARRRGPARARRGGGRARRRRASRSSRSATSSSTSRSRAA